jgi:hypothetical protein
LIQSKHVFPLLENFKIKYGFEAFEMKNNFHYWNFSNFRIEFELKIKEALGFEVRWNLMDFDLNFQELMKFEQGVPVCTRMTHNSKKGVGGFRFVSFSIYFKNLI